MSSESTHTKREQQAKPRRTASRAAAQKTAAVQNAVSGSAAPTLPRSGNPVAAGTIRFRPAQAELIRGIDRYGVVGFLARRQFGKTTTLSAIALKKMMKRRDHTVIFGSVKLNLGREIVRKESEIIRSAIRSLEQEAIDSQGLLKTVDGATGKDIIALSDDDYAELFETQRLEFRYYHDRGSYSRTKVVALRPDTVGETGDLMADEISRKKDWAETWEAIEPIAQSNPDFRILLATTPSPDDAHLSNEQLAPPVGTPLPVNPLGNWYRTDMGIWVLRVDAFDAYAGGVPVYDLETREALAPAEHRRRAHDKDAWDRNYGVKFILGGTSAVGLLQLNSAQTRGIDKALLVIVDTEEDFQRGLDWLVDHLGPRPVGLGWDLATTENETSNPSSFVVKEDLGNGEWIDVVTFVWKTRDPAIAKARCKRIVQTVNARGEGGRARKLCVDGSNERYFAVEVQREMAGLVPVEIVVSSENIEIPGQEPMSKKAYLGNELVDDLDNNKGTLPPEKYLKDDFRRVKRDRGSFSTEMGPNGEHGDTFDGSKLALHALRSNAGAMTSTDGIVVGSRKGYRTPTFKPRRLS